MRTLLIVVNVDWAFITHRLLIAKKAKDIGWDVYVAAKDTGRKDEITSCGIKFINFEFSRSGTNIIKECYSLINFLRLYRKIKPDVVHHITLKPVIYGSLIAKLIGVKGVLNSISGLGYTFTGNSKGVKHLVSKVMLVLMRYSFARQNISFIFQNKDDFEELDSFRVLNKHNDFNFIKGVGVDLNEFKYTQPSDSKKTIIAIATRMLKDKGLEELKEATQILKEKYFDRVTFILAGIADKDNKAGISESFLNEWQDGEYVKWIGHTNNMVEFYTKSHIVTLPSYREGMPRTLIEACAIGRPIVTTTAIGCRECVDEGINGFKVEIRSAVSLAQALEKLIENPTLRKEMGYASRKKAEKEFDIENVINHHLSIYTLLNSK